MVEKLVGFNDTTADGSGATNYFVLSKAVAIASGDMTIFYVRSTASGNVKCALYADNAGEPGALITAMNTGQAVVSGWNALTFTSTPITSGTTYWLAINCEGDGSTGYKTTGGLTLRYKAATYSTFSFPNPAGGGFPSLDYYYDVIAGWGTTGTTYDETGKVQTILVVMGKNDASIINELGKLQVVLTAQGESNLATLNEIGKEQIILAIIESWAGIIYQEIELEQIILAIQGKTESATFNETGKLQVILAEIVGWVGNLYEEIGRLQVILVAQGGTDSAIVNELSKIQTILSIWGKSTQVTFNETGRLQVILAKIGEIELITARLVKLLLQIQSKTNMNLQIDSKAKMDLEVGSKSLMQLELMGGGG